MTKCPNCRSNNPKKIREGLFICLSCNKVTASDEPRGKRFVKVRIEEEQKIYE